MPGMQGFVVGGIAFFLCRSMLEILRVGLQEVSTL